MPSPINVIHSGNLGDIVYSIPTALALAEGRQINYYLKINTRAAYGNWYHPLTNVMLNKQYAEQMLPLLQAQPYIHEAKIYNGEHIDYDLDRFRHIGLDLGRGHIGRWLFLTYGVQWDLSKAWIDVEPDYTYKDAIIVTRSHRYRNDQLNYRFLKNYNVVFLGLEEEYSLFKQQVPNADFVTGKDFLQCAKWLKGCKFAIANQTLMFAISEAMKIPRILEIYRLGPNVIVSGGEAYDVWLQENFEKIVQRLDKSWQLRK